MNIKLTARISGVLTAVAIAPALVIAGHTPAVADETSAKVQEAGQETSDRTPGKDTDRPLSQVEATKKGATSDRTPGTQPDDKSADQKAIDTADQLKKANQETSDRTPGQDTDRPMSQVEATEEGATSDRTPSDN